MPKPLRTITVEGRVVGTRRTDRSYTHAVLQTGFVAEQYLTLMAQREPSWTDWHAKQAVRHAAGPRIVSWHGSADLAHKAAMAASVPWWTTRVVAVDPL